jgi:(5-formylfuran-3-yl)methyl phosphate transaminase
MDLFSSRVNQIQPFIVMELLEAAIKMEQQGVSVVHMEIGEPDFPTPEKITQAASNGCIEGKTHYTHSQGILELRNKISLFKKQTRNVAVDPVNEVIVTAGSSPAFFIVLGALINPGDEVIITDPGYPCYQNFIRFFGGVVKFVKIYEKDSFNINPEELKQTITPKTKLLILNSPSNPTGQIIPFSTLKEIANLALQYNFYIISDEIYADLTYTDKRAPSISEIPDIKDRVIVLDGFSKYYAMTGWRLGYIIAPPDLTVQMNKINQNFFICAPSMSQVAGIAALDCITETTEMLKIYKNRRDFIIKRINEIERMHINPPSGAFYAFANISELSMDSKSFAWSVLENAHVAATPGIGFGANGEGFIRFSYCTDIKNIAEGMDRIEKYIKKTY